MIRTMHLIDGSLTQRGREGVQHWELNGGVLWVDIVNENDADETQLLKQLGCHTLAIRDAQRLRHPPKVESFENNCFLLYRGFNQCGNGLDIQTMQLGIFVNKNLLITRRNGESIGVETVWHSPQLIKQLNDPAVVLSKIINASAERYLEAVLDAEKEVSDLEDDMLDRPDDALMQRLILLKSHFRKLLRIFRYHTRVFQRILSGFSEHIDMSHDAVKHSFHDAFDKLERLESLCSMYYDICGDLIEGYISLSSHRLNKTMQVLTVITAIFVPLTFIAGIYGMNFEYIPELGYRNGYFVSLGAMSAIALCLLGVFRAKKWL
ncbi:magnesium transporter CorA family protein [Echinimonas agarilytica]|uniref:Magnesium transporter CorA family protein n=1 Tax=Echinimonas agarilytica TaxID=1215918 RepID=A0AA41W6J4_9GAMM|nr:magnesium transporter CorA family protein [Echinimonas agarilytica]MCM2679608.1 magnesium transporter CorA family protein [Echinimonas agarilytica]